MMQHGDALTSLWQAMAYFCFISYLYKQHVPSHRLLSLIWLLCIYRISSPFNIEKSHIQPCHSNSSILIENFGMAGFKHVPNRSLVLVLKIVDCSIRTWNASILSHLTIYSTYTHFDASRTDSF